MPTSTTKRELTYLAHSLTFEDYQSFSDLFTSAVPYDSGDRLKNRQEWTMIGDRTIKGEHSETNVITSWCNIQGALAGKCPSLHVTPTAEIISWIRSNMLPIDYDHIYFQITIRDANQALVSAQYNTIIGSRWLALVDPWTVPGYKLERFTLSALQAMPTLDSGHFDNLKIDGPYTRVWLSHMTKADGMKYDNQVTVQRLKDGVWRDVSTYKALK